MADGSWVAAGAEEKQRRISFSRSRGCIIVGYGFLSAVLHNWSRARSRCWVTNYRTANTYNMIAQGEGDAPPNFMLSLIEIHH